VDEERESMGEDCMDDKLFGKEAEDDIEVEA